MSEVKLNVEKALLQRTPAWFLKQQENERKIKELENWLRTNIDSPNESLVREQLRLIKTNANV